MINILKQIALVSVVLLILFGLGTTVNAIIPWIWLTHFFTILRSTMGMFDFIWDIDTLFTLVGLVFAVEIAYWAFRGSMTAVRYLRHKE